MARWLDLPMWMKKHLRLDDLSISVYVNHNDNSDYCVYETEEFMLVDDADDQQLDKLLEGNNILCHTGRQTSEQLPVPRKRHAKDSRCRSNNAEPPFNRKKQPTYCVTEDYEQPPQASPATEGEGLTLISFTNYCRNACAAEDPPPELLREIYGILDGFVITSGVMKVVVTAIKYVINKNLKNTMRKNDDKLDKKSRRQLRYILDRIARSSLESIKVNTARNDGD